MAVGKLTLIFCLILRGKCHLEGLKAPVLDLGPQSLVPFFSPHKFSLFWAII